MKPRFYLEEIWIEGTYNMDYPPSLMLRKRCWWIFYKNIMDFGILGLHNDTATYKIAERYCHLLNLLSKRK